MPKWCVFVHSSTCVCEMYVHRIIMSACVWMLLLGAFTLLSIYCSCCHRMALPAELYQQDVGEVENYFFLLWCRCSLNLFTGFREEKKKAIWLPYIALMCICMPVYVFLYIAKGNKCPLSLSKCQISYQHLPACCGDIYAHARTRVQQAGGVAQTRSTGRSDTVNILLLWNGRTWHLKEMHHLLSNASW